MKKAPLRNHFRHLNCLISSLNASKIPRPNISKQEYEDQVTGRGGDPTWVNSDQRVCVSRSAFPSPSYCKIKLAKRTTEQATSKTGLKTRDLMC